MIHGQTGTGKELVARQIHALSLRSAGPFVPVDCTTLTDSLAESQLFGHVKGAFTGADKPTLGFFRAANGGTLFLDEVGELPLRIQAKLLRCLQDGAVVPLGGTEQVPVNVRVLAATHRNLKEMVRRGEFREDLYFRLNVVRMTVPSLRERREDIESLAGHFLAQQAEFYQEPCKTLSPETLAALKAYSWPGNVRELANAIESACALATETVLKITDLPETIQAAVTELPTFDLEEVIPLAEAERRLISKALRVTNGNQAKAADMLQIERRRLYRKVEQYGLKQLINSLSSVTG